MADKCECKSDCDHHKGKPCPAEALTLPTEWLVDDKFKEGTRFRYGTACDAYRSNDADSVAGPGGLERKFLAGAERLPALVHRSDAMP